MRRWRRGVLSRICALARRRRVRFTHKAVRELAELGLDEEDGRDVLATLAGADSAGRVRSEISGEWMYVFKPVVGSMLIYMKVVLRADCIVVSFHEEGHGDGDEGSE
ncbi:MAG: type II toxin-antitoxin system MqsR family toxin [Candidatus Eisenbacteria bacterium]|nr:type II toxin-antitoxin system MqsR family toxin [Candidatus Eisenbacteria bacterium]